MEPPDRRREFNWVVGATSVVFFALVISLLGERSPGAIRIREAVYGDRPLGLPWQLVHVGVCVLIVLPFPVMWLNGMRLFLGAAQRGIRIRGVVSFFRHVRTIRTIPELRAPLFWHTLIACYYIALLIAWIVYAARRGI